jgi:RND family efflux transporter MFP subunit
MNPSRAKYPILGLCLLWAASAPLAARDYPAVVQWHQRAELATGLDGQVAEVLVRPGQRVAAGELLLRMDDRALKLELAASKARLQRLRLERAEAMRERERAEELYERTLLSEHDRRVAELQSAQAASAYQEESSRQQTLLLDLQHARIEAPFAGVVVALHVRSGDWVVNRFETRPLLTLADDRRFRARATLRADQIEELRGQSQVQVRLADASYVAEPIYEAREPAADVEGFPVYHLDLLFQVDEGVLLKVGQKVKIEVAD